MHVFFVIFHACCSHAQVLRRTLMHVFLIFSSHTDWHLHFSLCNNNENIWKLGTLKLNYKPNP